MKWLIGALALSLICILMQAAPGLAQSQIDPNRRTVEVTGHGDANAKPDAMIVSFAVDTQAPTADECTQAHSEKVRKVIDTLKAQLGADAKIETSEYSLNPQTTFVQSSAAPPPPRALWQFSASITANSDSIDQMGVLVDAGMAAGATRLRQSGIDQIPDDEEPAPSFFWRRKHRRHMKRATFVTLEVEAEGGTAADATRIGSPRVAQVEKVLQQRIGDHGTVELTEFSIIQLDPNNQNRFPMPSPPPPQQVQNFAAHSTVTADSPKLDLLGPVVQTGIDSGATRLNQVQFTLRNDSDARREAIEKASAEAKMKAQSVSKSMRVALGKIIHISTNAQVRPQVVYGASLQMAQVLHRAETATAAAIPVLPHEVGFSADVTVVYEIE